MTATCSLCKEALAEDGPATTSYGNEDIYSFCSKECGDEWSPPVAPEKDSHNQQQTME